MHQPLAKLLLPMAAILLATPSAIAQTPAANPNPNPNATAAVAVTVTNTHDGKPFQYEERGASKRGGFTVLRLTYPSPVTSALPQNNTVPADLFLPANLVPGEPKRPAVICLPILNGDEELTTMICSVLVQRGIPAIMFRLPYYGERGPAEGRRALAANPATFITAVEQAYAEIRRTVDLLASRPEIDPQRIGIAGISLGGIMSATAAGADPRLYRASLMLAGGDLQTIIHHAGETRQLSEMIKRLPPAERAAVDAKLDSIDPLRHAAALRERALQGRVLMLNAGQDEVIPRACTDKLAAALGITNQVVWFEGFGHYTALAELPRALRMTADFFAQDLPPGVKPPTPPPAAPGTNALQRLLAVAQQLVTMATVPPAPGRCHFLEGSLTGHDKQGKPVEGDFRMVMGAAGKFMLRVKSPQLGEFAAGQGQFPWLLAPVNGVLTVFSCSQEPVAGSSILSYVDPQHPVKLQLLSGAFASVMMVPDLAQRWVAAEFESAEAGGALKVTPRETRKNPGALKIKFQPDSTTPSELTFNGDGMEGTLRVRGWQTNTIAAEALFEPPDKLPRREVSQTGLQRNLAAVLNFAGDQVKIGKPPPPSETVPAVKYDRLKFEEFLKIYTSQ